MDIHLYNTLSRKKEIFQPIKSKKIRMYSCGITVYDDCHIGHARTQIAFDIIVRYFRFCDYEVTYVRNITDIDDKIIKRANENKETIDTFVDRTIDSMYHDLDFLNILRPDFNPTVRQTIPEIQSMIKKLIYLGFAYISKNGDVYYHVNKYQEYGKLSKQNLSHLYTNVQILNNRQKKNPLDFVLWKSLKKDNEPSFDSPWGKGRPGWHIECSAMSKKLLGDHFDIHAGGADLCFPHHENEIAQSEVANGCKLANYWLHSGIVQINNEKMSKSLSNVLTIKDILKEYHPEVLRLFLISSQYRAEINFSKYDLERAKLSLDRLYTSIRYISVPSNMPADILELYPYVSQFKQAMNNDFNTPKALSVLFNIAREINKYRDIDIEKSLHLVRLLLDLSAILGILRYEAEDYFHYKCLDDVLSPDYVEKLISKRLEAKCKKNYKSADLIRNQLRNHGIILEDRGINTTWKREKKFQ